MTPIVQERTMHTYFASIVDGKRAVKYLRDRNLLSTYRTIKRGHHKFILHMPPYMNETAGRKVLAEAFPGVHIEPGVYSEVPAPAAGTFPGRQAFGRALRPVPIEAAIGTHAATLNLFREPDGTFEITVASAAMAIFGSPPKGVIEEAIVSAAERIKARLPAPVTTIVDPVAGMTVDEFNAGRNNCPRCGLVAAIRHDGTTCPSCGWLVQ